MAERFVVVLAVSAGRGLQDSPGLPSQHASERTRRRGAERLPHIKIGKYIRFRRKDIVDGWTRVQDIILSAGKSWHDGRY